MLAWNCAWLAALWLLASSASAQTNTATPTKPEAHSAQATPRPEYEVKAAFIYKFALYVEWPQDAHPDESKPIVIAIAGKDPFVGKLEQAVKDKTVQHHKIAIRHIKSAEEVRGCHILFIAASEADRMQDYLLAVKGTWILTIGDTPNMAARGVMINLIQRNSGVGFEINRETLEHAGLKASSQMLDLAQIVKSTVPPRTH